MDQYSINNDRIGGGDNLIEVRSYWLSLGVNDPGVDAKRLNVLTAINRYSSYE